MTYPLGWSIIPHMLIRRERWPGGYGIRSSALVYPGQEVQANQPVLRLGKLDSQVVESRGTQKDFHAHHPAGWWNYPGGYERKSRRYYAQGWRNY